MYSSSPAQPIFEIVQAGLQTSLQDGGRWGYRAAGVPASGALDRFAYEAANVLTGNEPRAAVLELLLSGLVVRCLAATIIAITGADLGATLDGNNIPSWAAYRMEPGQQLAFTQQRSGARAYLGVAGGIAVEPILGSRSTYLPGSWGGFKGRALRAGDIVEAYQGQRAKPGWLPPEHRPPYSSTPELRCVAGPHLALFSDEASEGWQATTYTLSNECDRMGYRVVGTGVEAVGTTLPSCGVLPGVVQVPPGQAPILLMADAQTTGGYPIIGTVIGADLPLAAQLLPGDKLTFRLVGLETAYRALQEQQGWLQAAQEMMVEGVAI